MPTQPDILLIFADQMRWDCLGCMGNPVIQTPNLDALAARGMLFRNAFTPDPICVPARATVMTGRYPHICTGRKNNSGQIKPDQPLLTEVLKAAQYRTYAMGKLHFSPYAPPGQPRLVHGYEHVDLHESGRILGAFDPQGKQRGLEDYADYLKDVGWAGFTRAHGIGNNDVRPCASPLPPEHTVDHWIADCTIKQIDQHVQERPDQPFYMYMSSPKPHSPYDPPRPYDSMYDPRNIPPPFGSAASLAGRNSALDRTRYSHAADSLSPEAWLVSRAYYYGCISWLDVQIGRVLEHLRSVGRLDNTLIMFSADHGDLLGDFGSVFKSNHLNGSVRVPLIVAGPGVQAGVVSEALVGLQDILPTFASAANAQLNQSVQGYDLAPVFSDPTVTVRDCYYATCMSSPDQTAMVCTASWKYIYNERGGIEELYNQTDDPAELVNLAGHPAHAARQTSMRELLKQQARLVEDTQLFDGDQLRQSAPHPDDPAKLPVKGMGWRWY